LHGVQLLPTAPHVLGPDESGHLVGGLVGDERLQEPGSQAIADEGERGGEAMFASHLKSLTEVGRNFIVRSVDTCPCCPRCSGACSSRA